VASAWPRGQHGAGAAIGGGVIRRLGNGPLHFPTRHGLERRRPVGDDEKASLSVAPLAIGDADLDALAMTPDLDSTPSRSPGELLQRKTTEPCIPLSGKRHSVGVFSQKRDAGLG
jgi:hypothetical protein